MGALGDLLTTKVTKLQTERARIVANHALELARVDGQIAQLQTSAAALSPAIERAYDALLAQGLIQPVNR